MTLSWTILWGSIPVLAIAGFFVGRRRALALAGQDGAALHSLPNHYGQYVLLCAVLPALMLLFFWAFAGGALVESVALDRLGESGLLAADQDPARLLAEVRRGEGDRSAESISDAHRFLASTLARAEWIAAAASAGLVAIVGALGMAFSRRQITPELRARNRVESALRVGLALCSLVAILTTIGIVLSLVFEAWRFFQVVSPLEFFFGTEWSPQMALRADQVGSSGAFGAVPIFAGTLLITTIAMCVSIPVGLMAAIHLSFYASDSQRAWVKPVLEILAGIPTVVWGSFAALTLAPWVRRLGESLGLEVALESALAAGLVMGIMIIPFVSSLSDDALRAVPRELRDGSLALGSTVSETIRKVMVPAALPGIVGAFLLAVSRAIGETMIVVMAAGLAANLTANPFAAVTTVTVQIVSLLQGDQEFDSAKTLAAFALGLTLFVVTLGLNLIALATVRRYREQYD